METKIEVIGMSCEHCVSTVTDALAGVPGVDTVVEVSLDRNEAVVNGSATPQQLVDAITSKGFEAKAN